MLKILGRIILAVVGVWLIAASIKPILDVYNDIKEQGMTIQTIFSNLNILIPIATKLLNVVLGLIAIFGAISGKASLILTICGLVMIFDVVYQIYVLTNGFVDQVEVQQILSLVGSCLRPVLYFLGSVLVRFQSGNKN